VDKEGIGEKRIKGGKGRLDGWYVACRIRLRLREYDDTHGKPHNRMIDIDLVCVDGVFWCT
jgi:hypothetical protein